MQPELPKWKCHKIVQAAKIVSIEITTTGAILHLEGGIPAEVNLLWQDRHHPEVGGYYVVYNEGQYASFSPAKPFEGGYTRMTE
jgi:hypothetical protein